MTSCSVMVEAPETTRPARKVARRRAEEGENVHAVVGKEATVFQRDGHAREVGPELVQGERVAAAGGGTGDFGERFATGVEQGQGAGVAVGELEDIRDGDAPSKDGKRGEEENGEQCNRGDQAVKSAAG